MFANAMKTQLLMALGVLVALAACNRQSPVVSGSDPASPASLTPVQMAKATERGKAIVAETFGLLSSNLQSSIVSGGVSNALPYCSLAASPLTASMAQKHGVSLRRFTHKPRNPAGMADVVELGLLDQFRKALAFTNTVPPVVAILEPGTVTFVAPIVLNNPMCLNCHGEPDKDIKPENIAIIRGLYPRDQATGFRLGELRGAWRIDFPVSSL